MDNGTHMLGEQRLRSRAAQLLSTSPGSLKKLRPEVALVHGHLFEVVHRLDQAGVKAYLFGGALRDTFTKPPSMLPRDIDIVVDVPSNAELAELFSDISIRRTRFGGVKLEKSIQFDIWALPETWAFKEGAFEARVEELPKTTFLNVEAVAMQICPTGASRKVYSGGFFEAIETRTLNINFEPNPHPALCVVRALHMALQMDFAIGNNLAEYLVWHRSRLSVNDLLDIQRSHYGQIHHEEAEITDWIDTIEEQLNAGASRITLPTSRERQQYLFSEACYQMPHYYSETHHTGKRHGRRKREDTSHPQNAFMFALIGGNAPGHP